MKTNRLATLALVCTLCLCTAILLRMRASSPAPQREAAPAAPANGEAAVHPSGDLKSQGEHAATETAAKAEGQERAEVPIPIAVISITDENQKPIQDAQCRWGELPPPDFSALYVWGLIDWESESGHEQVTRTNVEGLSVFAAAPEGTLERDSLVWAWAPGFSANWTILGPSSTGEPRSGHIVLSPSRSIEVSVLDGDKNPVSDATIHVVGLTPAMLGVPPELTRRAFRGFRLSTRTDKNGYASIAPLQGSHVIWAVKGDLSSIPELDVPAEVGSVKLVLRPTFVVTGHATAADAVSLEPAMQVTAYAMTETAAIRTAQCLVKADGTIGPFPVPCIQLAKYDFTLRGGGALPCTVSRPSPPPNTHVELDFNLRAGLPLQVEVQDEQDAFVEGAKVLVQWDGDGGGAQVALTNERGVADLRGVHSSGLNLKVTATGYVPGNYQNLNALEYQDDGIGVVLQHGGTLRGRVVHQDAPVKDFIVVYWPARSVQARAEATFHAAQDGRFEIVGAPVGDLLVYANADRSPRSEVRAIHIDQATPAEVLLELPNPLTGRGQVLDGATGDPIPSAKVEIWNSYRAGYLSPAGPIQPVGPDGRFTIEGFPLGESRYVVRAEGYTQFLGLASGRTGEEIDLGIVALQRGQRLQVRLTSTKAIDFTQYSCNADGNAAYPIQSFGADGLAGWPNAGPNLYFVRVFLPDESLMSFERYCRPGGDWEFVFPQDPTRTLQVLVVDADGNAAELKEGTAVRLLYSAAGGHQLVHRVFIETGSRAHFSTVASRHVYAEVVGDSGDRLAAGSFTLEDGANEVRLTLGGKSVRVHVTSPDGVAVEGASLDARMAAGESPWFQLSSTDAAGLHTFTGLGMKKLFINVQHDQYGVKSDVEVDLETWDIENTLEIKLDPRATVAVRLVDGKNPVPAASVRILGPHSGHILGVFTSDAGGGVRYGPVAPGSYLVSVEQPGVWLTEQLIEAGDKDHPRDVQVRKLGGLELHLESSSGKSTAGIRVDLESGESGAKLSDWIQRGLVDVGGSELVSSEGGVALVTGIPHGEYAVRLTSQAGSYVAGRVTVNPGPPTSAALYVQ